ncbi:MAG TPA: hypothetical protein VFA43_18925 [Gemmatimonadaceae bacterium]|nr:hypothetical protein [Gemmatimonadaceae bacterium]
MLDPDLVAAVTVPLSIFGTVYAFMRYGVQWRMAKMKPGTDLENRLARLEVAIDDMTAELQRVTEGQQLVTKLLAEKSLEAGHGSR